MHTASAPFSDQRLAWFRAAKFGMLVHFGSSSVLGMGEQIMFPDLMPLAEHQALAARFDPAPDWAERLCATAVDAGARYIVLTTRHHHGSCLFDTATHDFNAARTGPGRNLVAEFVAAARAAGLKIEFYHSVHPWRVAGLLGPPGPSRGPAGDGRRTARPGDRADDRLRRDRPPVVRHAGSARRLRARSLRSTSSEPPSAPKAGTACQRP